MIHIMQYSLLGTQSIKYHQNLVTKITNIPYC